ncbi:serine/threonine-protein phosphatase 6 regulatory ankyrin repeat subunit B-like [Neltuma alba]|uniref:serine/threonine-protein phosphatase 6 regulatory ankyrin repeat subunit B-like n=1 Tax=Neltuma alba TaxID=207710 RepID=UPI0010A53E35|nr:serine/threonine-protein phosphatase 6 regulatory ankyrin repeat subunit B-like [Prosopis alba]
MHNSKLAFELDSCRSTVLHLASAEGHVYIIVKELQVFDEACLVRDEEGRIPLHCAVMRGRSNRGCERKHLETLQALVELELAVIGELIDFTSSDDAGNTILRLAIMLKRLEQIVDSNNLPREMELVKIETAHHHQDDERMTVLYEASYEGSVSTLNMLIQQDPLILHRINSRTILVETPLHISALLGHLEFTKALLAHKPKIALELDSFRSTPLHVASAEGHIDVVKQLLLYYDEACFVRDQEGRIPLHYAVIRGRLEVVKELIRVKPESSRILDKGKTIFHLCVAYNHLQIMKALIELATDDTYELLNERDLDGMNTILHLAVMLKRVETVRYLMSIPEIREATNLTNNIGYTAHDILQRIPQDFQCLEIQVILMNYSGIKKNGGTNTPAALMNNTNVVGQQQGRPRKKFWRNILKRMGKWFDHNSDNNWLEDMRGNLSLVATVVATITFQAVFNPPGNVIQQGILVSSNSTINEEDKNFTGFIESSPLGCLPFKSNDGHNVTPQACPGEAMLASRNPDGFQHFVFCNTMSFIVSLCIALLLVSGVPLKNKLVMWILCIAMCVALTFLAFAYFDALLLITPHKPWFTPTDLAASIAGVTWEGLLLLVSVYIITLLVIWLVKIKKHRIRATETETAFA